MMGVVVKIEWSRFCFYDGCGSEDRVVKALLSGSSVGRAFGSSSGCTRFDFPSGCPLPTCWDLWQCNVTC